MTGIEEQIDEAKRVLFKQIPFRPKIGIILGTGLTSLTEKMSVDVTIPYSDIPHFPVSTVETHTGNLIFGSWGVNRVAVLQGRVHYYEGYSLQEVTFPVRVMRKLGVTVLVVTNAAGGLDPDLSLGDIMAITDHINLIGHNPLRGANLEKLGVRFPSMHEPYSHDLIIKIEKAADDVGIKLKKGVYVAVPGPSLETAAETRFLRTIGADLVGMSTVPEVIAAVHAGIEVLGLSVIANVNIPASPKPVPIEEVVENVQKAQPLLFNLIERFLRHIQG